MCSSACCSRSVRASVIAMARLHDRGTSPRRQPGVIRSRSKRRGYWSAHEWLAHPAVATVHHSCASCERWTAADTRSSWPRAVSFRQRRGGPRQVKPERTQWLLLGVGTLLVCPQVVFNRVRFQESASQALPRSSHGASIVFDPLYTTMRRWITPSSIPLRDASRSLRPANRPWTQVRIRSPAPVELQIDTRPHHSKEVWRLLPDSFSCPAPRFAGS